MGSPFPVFTFQNQDYIGLDVAINHLLHLSLEHVLVELAPALCFHYQGMVVTKGERIHLDGLVFPELNTITTRQVSAALLHGPKPQHPATTPAGQQLSAMITNPSWRALQKGYSDAKTAAGNASTHNAILKGQPVTPADFFQNRATPDTVFHLTEWVVPYYVLPVEQLQAIADEKGIPLDLSLLKGCERKSFQTVNIDRCGVIASNYQRTTGDALIQAAAWYKQKMEQAQGQLKAIQDEHTHKAAELQQAHALIQELQQQLAAKPGTPSGEAVSSPMQRKAAAKLIGALTLKAFPTQTRDKGLQSHGLITAIRNVAGVSHEAAKYWLDLAEEVLPE
ncbi:hypothetical protein EV700_1210 [Fluviicoccus keumensis]|uniref:Uncharacterized protein n=1 Tax=Fluviicoccus keumensis TaxID=1435465 RepID=A0A4Q7Z8J0_9GAMM|nr:hypothetical protein [Fluviicoccus keumensis]RZU46827.1 hypothetical protein EV700_1210 [Fluviicoccus keumensis]